MASDPLFSDEPLEFPSAENTPPPNSKAGRVVKHEHREEAAASQEDIDSQLASMTRRTTIEELAKRGKTKNIKTLSERNLKQWIREALRRVISNSTTIDSQEEEKLLANTRKELSAIMAERQAEANNRAADERKLAELSAQQQSMGRRVAELEQELAAITAERDSLAEQVQDLDADLGSQQYSSNNEAIERLRQERDHAKDKYRKLETEQAQLRKHLGRQLVASAEVVTALLAIDQRFYNGRYQPTATSETDKSSIDEESEAFFADQNAAAAVAQRVEEDLAHFHSQLSNLVPTVSENDSGALVADQERLEHLIWKQVHEEMVDELQQEIDDLKNQLASGSSADAALQQQIRDLQSDLDEAEITAEAFAQRVDELSRQVAEAGPDLSDELAKRDARLAKLQDQCNEWETEDARKQQRLAELEQQLAEQAQELTTAQAQAGASEDLRQAQAHAAGLQEELDRLRGEYDTLSKDLSISQGTLASLRRQLVRAQDAAAKTQPLDEIEPLRQELKQAEEAAAGQRQYSAERDAEVARLRTAHDQLAGEFERLQGVVKEHEAGQAELSGKLQKQTAAADQVRQDLAQQQSLAAAAEHERDQLRSALQAAQQQAEQADAERRMAEQRAQQAETEVAALKQHSTADADAGLAQQLKQAQDRIEKLEPQAREAKELSRKLAAADEAAATSKPTSETDGKDLSEALSRARAMVTTSDGAPYEDITGAIAPRKPGMWFTAWRDPKGRFKNARTVGERWVNVGRNKDIPIPEGLADEPVILSRGEEAYAVWRDIDGIAASMTLDKNGRPTTPPHSLGPAIGTPCMSRGGGEAPIFTVVTDPVGHIHLHEAGGGEPLNMHKHLHNIPLAAGPACAWHWGLEGSRHIAYRDHQDQIQELLELQGIWYHANLSQQTDAPPAVGDPIGYAPADHEHILYLGSDGHVHELCFNSKEWLHHDLNNATPLAPAASNNPSGAYVNGRHCVCYRGVDGHAHLLRHRRDWRYHDLSNLGMVAPDLFFASCGNEGALVYHTDRDQRRWARFGDTPETLSVEDLP